MIFFVDRLGMGMEWKGWGGGVAKDDRVVRVVCGLCILFYVVLVRLCL